MSDKPDLNLSKVYYVIFAFGALLLVAYICLLTVNFNHLDATTSGAIGDAFGGVATPFVGVAGVLLTFMAFWVQYIANERQREAYEQQRNDIKRERFENKFYELLKLHKENVNEIRIPIPNGEDLRGRECFRVFYDELESIYFCCIGLRNEKGYDIDNEDLLNVSYELFHYGLDYGYDHVSKKSEYRLGPFLKEAFNILKDNRSLWVKEARLTGLDQPRVLMSDSIKLFRFEHKPFSGGYLFLGHYYRHIYQILKLIDSNKSLTYEEKYEFIKVLRASLSSFEQAVLYLNSFWGSGKKLWLDFDVKTGETSRYMLDYKLIKNINFHLVDYAVPPQHKFKEELKKAYPDKDDRWLNEATFEAFEELENLMTDY